MSSKLRGWDAPLAASPAIIITGICSGLPLLWMAVVVITNPQVRGEFGLDAVRTTLLGRTVGYNFVAGLIATVMGLPAAFVLGRGRGLFARLMWVVLPAAVLMPSLSYAYGWAQLVRLARPYLRPYGILFRPNGPADVFRCIWSLATWLWAVPAALIGLTLRRLDSSVQQQALLDGGLRRVTFRQLLGAIIASIAIVTILATQEFAVYEPTGISVIATEVRMVFDTGSLSTADMPITVTGLLGAGKAAPDQAARAAAAVATTTPLLIVTIALAFIAAWGAASLSTEETLEVSAWPPILDASWFSIAVTCLLLIVNIALPVWGLFHSLRTGFSPHRMVDEFGPQLIGAMLMAGMAAAVAVISTFFAAAQWTPSLLAISGASFLIGGQLLAIGLIRIYNRPGLFWIYDSAIVTVIAYVGRFGWLALSAGRSAWSRPWQQLRDVAAVDGAGTLQTAWRVIWPLAWPMLVAGGLIVGALSLTEVPATVLLMPQRPQVLTPTLMTWVHMARFDPMIEASLLMMGAVLVPAVLVVLLVTLGLHVIRRDLPGGVGRRN